MRLMRTIGYGVAVALVMMFIGTLGLPGMYWHGNVFTVFIMHYIIYGLFGAMLINLFFHMEK